METYRARYLEALKDRHERDLEILRVALRGRRPRALKAIERRQEDIERETARILESVSGGEHETKA